MQLAYVEAAVRTGDGWLALTYDGLTNEVGTLRSTDGCGGRWAPRRASDPPQSRTRSSPPTRASSPSGRRARCVSATSPDLTTTEAVYEWRDVAGGEEVSGNGYFIVADHFGPDGNPVGRRSALMAVVPRVNDLYTTDTFTLTGAELVRFGEPESGDRVAATRLVR
ncbi:MAG: hypothetical protein M3337_07360 [Actinomycetota bacterium]|nr:hypothetical protein [Actinomycetota bacterium]